MVKGQIPPMDHTLIKRRLSISLQFIIGYKLHLIVSKQGTPVDMMVTPANVHDINFLKENELQLMNCELIGDRAYLSSVNDTTFKEFFVINTSFLSEYPIYLTRVWYF